MRFAQAPSAVGPHGPGGGAREPPWAHRRPPRGPPEAPRRPRGPQRPRETIPSILEKPVCPTFSGLPPPEASGALRRPLEASGGLPEAARRRTEAYGWHADTYRCLWRPYGGIRRATEASQGGRQASLGGCWASLGGLQGLGAAKTASITGSIIEESPTTKQMRHSHIMSIEITRMWRQQ